MLIWYCDHCKQPLGAELQGQISSLNMIWNCAPLAYVSGTKHSPNSAIMNNFQ